MLLQQLALRVQGDEHLLRFHGRATVVAGLSIADRQGIVEVLLGTLAGEPTVSSELALVDRTGRRVVIDQTAEGSFHTSYDDGSLALPAHIVLGLSVQDLFELTYVGASHLGLADRESSEPRDLTEARGALVALADQLDAARLAHDAADALRVELVSLERDIRKLEADRPRRRYARILMALERARSERAAVCAEPAQAEADKAIMRKGERFEPLASAWRDAHWRLEQVRRQFGSRERLDAQTLAGALSIPDHVPPNLELLVEEFSETESRRASVSAQLAALMASHLRTPSHPDVARLARHDQTAVWTSAARALQTGLALERESILAGGLVAGEERPPLVEEIETAHLAVEQAQEMLEKRRFGAVAAGGAAALGAVALPLAPMIAPLALAGAASAAWWSILSPRQQLAEAQGWEEDALVRAGLPSYIAFHLRRLEAMHDPAVRDRLERATRDHRTAMAEWRQLAGDLSPIEALELEAEVRSYADALNDLEGLGAEIDVLRRRLTEEVEPEVERTREALMEVCRPFGIESPTLATDMVRQLAEVARFARIQRDLEEAEAAEREARAPLATLLDDLGMPDGEIANRVQAFEDWLNAAADRVRFRAQARRVEELDEEIARLEALSMSEYRADFGSVFTAGDAEEPDAEALMARRDATATAYSTANSLVPDIAHLADRKSALERRVAHLEELYGDDVARGLSPERVSEIQHYLQDRIAALRHCGAGAESLPLILDDCFRYLRSDAKWPLLDMVDRLASSAQIVYLTEDPEVALWARRRSVAGTLGFVKPLAQPVPA